MKTKRIDLKFIRVLASLLSLSFLLGMGATIATAQDSVDESFETPEEAITFYMQAFAENDIAKIMQSLAVDEMSENFNFEAYVNRLQVLNIQSPAPSEYEFYVEINRAQFTSQILLQTRNLAYGLLATEKSLVEGQVLLLEPEQFAMFATEVNPERLAELEVVEIGLPFPEFSLTERAQEIWSAQAGMYGADELTERVVLFLFEDEYYFTGFNVLRYGDNWKISFASSVIAGSSALGGPTPTTLEEFQDMIASE